MRKLRITDDHPWVKYVIAAAVGLVIALTFCIWKDIFHETDISLIVRYLSDAFAIPGVLLTGIGLLSFLKKEGTFDGLFYSFHAMRMAYTKRMMDEATDETKNGRTYYDYKQNAKAKRKVSWHLVIVGGGFLLTAIVLTVVFVTVF